MNQNYAMEASSTIPAFGSNDIDNLINALFPDDETLKDQLDYEHPMIPANGLDDHKMITSTYDLGQFATTGQGYNEQMLPRSYQAQYYTTDYVYDNGVDIQANTMGVNFDHRFPSSSGSSTVNSSSNTSPVTSFSPDSSYSTENNFPQVSTPTWLPSSPTLHLSYSHLYLPNNLQQQPMDPGFKPTISLNTPQNKTTEPWKPSVGKKILEANFSPLSLKSEFLASQTALDEFQSLALKEALAAFHDVAFCSTNDGPNVCTNKFVDTCSKVRAYRRLHTDDKVTLLTNVFFDIIAMKSVITYDHLTDAWNYSSKKVSRRDFYRLDPLLHDKIFNIIETYPDRWRNDLTAAALVYLIVIFNPDLPGLKFRDAIRLEQYCYIYLLRRYLEATCESPSDASDYHYRLMCKIEEVQSLGKNMATFIDCVHYGSLPGIKDCITTLVK